MRRAFALVLFIAAPLFAQSIRLGPEHVIPPAVVDSAVSRLIALLPHGDALVAFWGTGGPLHATLLDPEGKFLSDTVVTEIPHADYDWTRIAQTADGYVVVDVYEETPPTVNRRTGSFALDFDFRLRATTPNLAVNGWPSSIACGDSRCAVVLDHANPYEVDDRYVMLLRLDGSIAADRLPLAKDMIGDLTAMPNGFLTLYRGTGNVIRSALFDPNGIVRNVQDLGKPSFAGFVGGTTAVDGGAIVVWPEDETLHAGRLDANGVVIATRIIATFSFLDFEGISVSCSGGECTAGVEWYYSSYMTYEGVWAPVAQIHAVRFAVPSLQAIDAQPVTIAIPDQNNGLNAVATPSGTLLAWSAFRGNSVRVAFLGRGATPYAGDPAIDGRAIMNGPAAVGKIAATRDAIAWTDFAINSLRNVRLTSMDDAGVPSSETPEVLGHDFFSPYSGDVTPSDLIVMGQAGGSRLVAWNNEMNSISIVRDAERMTVPGNILTMMSDGREVVLATSNFVTGAESLVRFGETGPPVITASPVRSPSRGALSNGKLFLQGFDETRFVDLDRQTSVSLGKQFRYDAFVFGDRSVTAVLGFRDQDGKTRLGVQRFGLDGHQIDAQPMTVGDGPRSIFAVPLGPRVLIVWDTSPYDALGAASYAVVFDPATRTVTQPLPIKNDERVINAVVSRDATHAIVVFRTYAERAVSTQRLELATDFHHRAAAR